MNLNYIQTLLSKLFLSIFDYRIIKLLLSIWLFFEGIHTYLFAVATLLIFDVVTGIYASYRNGRAFTSKYLKKGLLEKTLLYLVLIGASLAMEMVLKKMFGWENYYVVFFVTVLITTYECVSIFENILSINPDLSFLRSLITLSKRVNKGAINYVERKMDNFEFPEEKKTELPSEKVNDEVKV